MDFKISDVEVAMLWKEDRVGYQIKISFNHNKVTTYTDLSNDLNLFNEFNKYRKEYGQDFYDVLFEDDKYKVHQYKYKFDESSDDSSDKIIILDNQNKTVNNDNLQDKIRSIIFDIPDTYIRDAKQIYLEIATKINQMQSYIIYDKSIKIETSEHFGIKIFFKHKNVTYQYLSNKLYLIDLLNNLSQDIQDIKEINIIFHDNKDNTHIFTFTYIKKDTIDIFDSNNNLANNNIIPNNIISICFYVPKKYVSHGLAYHGNVDLSAIFYESRMQRINNFESQTGKAYNLLYNDKIKGNIVKNIDKALDENVRQLDEYVKLAKDANANTELLAKNVEDIENAAKAANAANEAEELKDILNNIAGARILADSYKKNVESSVSNVLEYTYRVKKNIELDIKENIKTDNIGELGTNFNLIKHFVSIVSQNISRVIYANEKVKEAQERATKAALTIGIKITLGGKLKVKGKSNKNSKKPVASQKTQNQYKEILGKRMKIYKMPDSRKEYVKYKGELYHITDYKNIIKQITKAKNKK